MSESGYLSAYRMMEDLLEDLGEYDAAKIQGTDTSGAWRMSYLLRKLNNSHRFLHALLMRRIPDEFKKTADLTFTSSVAALPADFGVLRILKDQDGQKAFSVEDESVGLTGMRRFYYRMGRSLYLDADSVNETYELRYYQRCRDLHYGKASAGAAKSMTLSNTARKEVDYYNGLKVENITKDWVDTISDYSAARVVTLAAETAAADDYYGVISDIPEDFHQFIPYLTALNIRGVSILSKDKSTKADRENFFAQLIVALSAYAGAPKDISPDDLFLDFEPISPVNIGVS